MGEARIHALNQSRIWFPKDAVDSTHRGLEFSDSLGQGLGLLFWQLFSSHKAQHEDKTGHEPEGLHNADNDEGVGPDGMEKEADKSP